MSLPKRTQSNSAIFPYPLQRPVLTIGRGQPKAHSLASNISSYKPVIVSTKTELVSSLSEECLPIGRLSRTSQSFWEDEADAILDELPDELLCDGQPTSALSDGFRSSKGKTELDLDLSSWGLPDKVVNAYRKINITSVFQWQAECLHYGEAMNGANLVYSAPTSAGKTLVAEILLLKRVVEMKKKGLFIVPFVSLAREKMQSLQKMLQGSGIRVGGYMGQIRPKGGMRLLDVAVCTIEKANSLVNRMVEEGKLDQLGVVVVDELHMVGDVGRGYLIELLLTKLSYLNGTRLFAGGKDTMQVESTVDIQLVAMSATLPNLQDIATWLKADLFISNYRPIPLYERVKLGIGLYDKTWTKVRNIDPIASFKNDPDHIVSLCLETVTMGHGVLVFCPTKNWCESLAQIVAEQFLLLEKEVRAVFLQDGKLNDVVAQLRKSPAGLDAVLKKTVPMGVSFHHAGLTMDEREILEGAFRKGYIKVLIATTTLAAGVNLPARRVIIRSPIFHKDIIDVLTYYQMAGRAGRKGVDTEGESILVCKETERPKVAALFAATARPVESSMLSTVTNGNIDGKMMQAALEIIVNGAAKSLRKVSKYFQCTLFAAQLGESQTDAYARSVVESLKSKELIQIAPDGEGLRPSQLGNAVVWSGLSPSDGEAVFQELQKARLSFNLETDLHILYLLTPLQLLEHVADLDWYHYLMLWERLPVPWKRVGSIVGVDEMTLATAVRGRVSNEADPTVSKQTSNMRRFYCALILNELIHEVPLSTVAQKYGVNKGMLQALQQGASSYSGMITIFCEELGWTNLAVLVEQLQGRLQFGVQRELVELVRVQYLTAMQARLLHQKGYTNPAKLAAADPAHIEELLRSSVPFQSEKTNEMSRGRVGWRNILLNGMEPLNEIDAAAVIIAEARRLLEEDMEALGWHIAGVRLVDKASAKNLIEDQHPQNAAASLQRTHSAHYVAEFIDPDVRYSPQHMLLQDSKEESEKENTEAFMKKRKY